MVVVDIYWGAQTHVYHLEIKTKVFLLFCPQGLSQSWEYLHDNMVHKYSKVNAPRGSPQTVEDGRWWVNA